jgi:hypothetical protein
LFISVVTGFFLGGENMLIKISTAIFLLPMLLGCVPTRPSPGGNGTTPKSGIELSIRTDKAAYRAKEPIKMQLTVTNKGDKPFEYTFSSTQIYDFAVKKEEEEIWRWSADKMFAMVLTDFTLEPKRSIVYDETWDQKDVDGNFVTLGQYELVGIIEIRPEKLSSPHAIEIKAE